MRMQEIYDRLSFLEGLVSDHTFMKIADTMMEIDQASYDKACEDSAKWCDELANLWPRKDVGFDMGYNMAASRAARDIRKQLWRL
jgi:hypothetical protein